MITRGRVEGMTCQHCVRAVFTALAGVEGIASAQVAIGSIEVDHDGRVTVEQLRDAVALAGYTLADAVSERRVLHVL